MSKADNLTDFLKDLANAIREKKGSSSLINPQDFSEEILSIQTGGGDDGDMTALIEGTLSHLSSPATTIRQYAFRGSTALKSVDLPNVVKIEGNAFYGCGLVSAEFPKCTSIDAYAIASNTQLVSVSLPILVTVQSNGMRDNSVLAEVKLPKCTTLGSSALRNCKALEKIDLPSASSIASYAFGGCSSLTTLILRSESVCALGAVSALDSTPIASGSGYIYVPSALVSEYKAAPNWIDYEAQIKSIDEL